jgi:hypothetical protein
MTRALCKAAIACALLVGALTIVPVTAGADPGSPSLTPVPGGVGAAESRGMLHLAQKPGYGKVCRNGRYACRMNGSGYIGYSCCGCGFCGWWSAD